MKLMSEHKFFPGFCFVKRVPPSKEKHWIFRVCWIICCSSTLTPWYISYPISVLFTFHPKKNVIQMKKKEQQRILKVSNRLFSRPEKKLLTKQLCCFGHKLYLRASFENPSRESQNFFFALDLLFVCPLPPFL